MTVWQRWSIRGERLFAEAPTGIGKTISVLFPAIKALGEGKAERLFYLTARTTARGAGTPPTCRRSRARTASTSRRRSARCFPT